MKMNKMLLAGVLVFGVEQIIVSGSGAIKDKVSQSGKAPNEKVEAKKAAVEKMKALSPTDTKVRLYMDLKTKQVKGVEVKVCQGDCNGDSIPYDKKVKEMQEKALSLVHQEGLISKMQTA